VHAGVVLQDHPEVAGRDRRAVTRRVREDQNPTVLLVKAAVAHLVKHVELLAHERSPQLAQCKRIERGKGHRPGVGELVQRLDELSPFGVEIEAGVVGGLGADYEHPQGEADLQRSRWIGHLHVADHRGRVSEGDEPVVVPVVKQLPREVGKLWAIGQAEPDPERRALPASLIQAAAEALAHRPGEDRIEEAPSEVLGRGDRLGVEAPGSGSSSSDLQREVLELQVGERSLKRPGLSVTRGDPRTWTR
jgi:hypothetical protein